MPVTNQEAEALKEAMRREVDIIPGVAGSMARVENVAQQILDGSQVAAESKPAWKTD